MTSSTSAFRRLKRTTAVAILMIVVGMYLMITVVAVVDVMREVTAVAVVVIEQELRSHY